MPAPKLEHRRTSLQMQLSQILYDEMKRRKLTQAAFAKQVPVSAKHLCRLLSGNAGGTMAMWSRLFEALGVKIYDPSKGYTLSDMQLCSEESTRGQ